MTDVIHYPEAEKLKQIGICEFKNGEIEAALSTYTKAIQLDPDNMEYPLSRAAVHMAARRYDLCVEDCKHVVELALLHPPVAETDELLAKAYARMGTAYFAQNKLSLAVRCCKSAYQTLPTPEFQQMLDQVVAISDRMTAKINNAKDNQKEQEKETEKGKGKVKDTGTHHQPESLASADAVNYCIQAKEAYKAGEYTRAATLYTLAISADPSHTRAVTYINRAACHQKDKQFELALEDSEKAIQLDPELAQGYFRKGCALEGLKQKSEALQQYEIGLRYNNDHPQLNKRYQILKKQLSKDSKSAKVNKNNNNNA